MATNTHFRVWRKYNEIVGDHSEILEIKEQYKQRNIKADWSYDQSKKDPEREKKHELDMPILLERGYKADRSFSLDDKNPREAYGNADGKLYSFLYEIWMGVALGKLRDYYGLNSYERSKTTAFVPVSDIKKIVQAAKYLLNGEYSDALENILDNEFISVLGDCYPKWEGRKRKNNNIYVDKNSEDSYTISFNDLQSDIEEDEENSSAELTLNKLLCCLQNVLEIETDYDGKEEIVLEICAF